MSIYEPHKIDTNDDSRCSGCFDFLKGEKAVVAHTGNGHLHPIHRECAIEWLKQKWTCPTCRTKIDASGMLSLKERCIQRYGLQKYVNKSTLSGGATALAVGAVMRSVWSLLFSTPSFPEMPPRLLCLEGYLGALIGFGLIEFEMGSEEDPWPAIKWAALAVAAVYLPVYLLSVLGDGLAFLY